MSPLKVGDPAPDFALSGTNAAQVHLADYKGQKQVVLALYPKDFTGG